MLCFVCVDACVCSCAVVGLFTNMNYYLEGNLSPLNILWWKLCFRLLWPSKPQACLHLSKTSAPECNSSFSSLSYFWQIPMFGPSVRIKKRSDHRLIMRYDTKLPEYWRAGSIGTQCRRLEADGVRSGKESNLLVVLSSARFKFKSCFKPCK